MPSLMGGIFGGDNTGMNDRVIANDMLAGGKSLATSYFTAQLESATPEIKRLFGEFATQKAQEHGALTNLAIQKGWYNAYGSTSQQLQDVYQQSGDVAQREMQQ